MISKRLAVAVIVAAVLAGPSTSPVCAQPAPAAASATVDAIQVSPRDAEGRLALRAVRVSEPLDVDGHTNERVYETVPPVADFVQMEPAGGQPATEKTEVWIFFNQQTLFVTLRAWESRRDLRIANEMRRDSNNIRLGDCIGFSLDTFHDGRNALQFEINPLGARTDGQSTNERQYNSDWNPVWDVAVADFAGGYTVEAAIPFKSIRYRPGAAPIWGFNARRNVTWKNEISFLARIPPAFGIGRGSFAASLFPTLTGLETPAPSINLEVKPYLTSNLTTDRVVRPAVLNDFDGNGGVDAKYAVTEGLMADFTLNTDFAQVEADEQQVNLTRFSLFFPEKREFFLENQGLFTFGSSSVGNAQGATALRTGSQLQSAADLPLLFYSRRIGLNQNVEVPILGGGRLTGRVGRYSLGVIDIGTRRSEKTQAPATNFSVVRLKRDILRRSSIGLIGTTRSTTQDQLGSNRAFGVDGTFAFFQNLAFAGYWAKTWTIAKAGQPAPEPGGEDTSYRAQMEYAGDRYGVHLERLAIGRNFKPDVGYVRRSDAVESVGQFRFSPRPGPRRFEAVRRFSGIATFNHIDNGAGELQTRSVDGELAIEFESSDRFSVGATDNFERLVQPFPITTAVRIPIGVYEFVSARAAYLFGAQRPVSGTVTVERGQFYSGHRTSLTIARGRVNPTARFSLEPNISINWIDLPGSSFTTNVIGSRATYTLTPLMFASALVQYNSSTHRTSTNLRFRWEYHPGSEVFVVFNEERDTLAPSFPDLQNRAFIVKINRLLRF